MLKSLVKHAALGLGYEVQRFAVATSHTARLRAMLATHGVNLILDVGANIGQFGCELRGRVGYRGRIVSFEPMQKAYAALARAAAADPQWELAPRAAIGAQAGTATLNIAGNSASSSVLGMLDAHRAAAPESELVGTEVVPLEPLDALAPAYFREDSVAFLKIDTQGYESEVLRGAPHTLARVTGLQLELSLIPLYEGQELMPELHARVQGLGFELWGLAPAFIEPRTGRMLQVDATFFRNPA